MKKGFPKSSAVLLVAAVSVLFGLIGCENTTSSDSGRSYTGVLGELSGVVFDELTGLPIPGVLVSAGEWAAYTDAAGAFTIDNVIPGTYTVSYSKAGYRIATQTDINIDSQEYKLADPYLEVDAYNKYYTLFTEWLSDRASVQLEMAQEDLPTLYGDGWVYNGGGTFTAESGDIQVSYNENTDDFDFTFEPDLAKLDYTYRYSKTLKVVALKPLSGGFEGEIKIVLAANDSTKMPAPIPAPAGLRVWIMDTSLGVDGPYAPSFVGKDGTDDALLIKGIYKAETDWAGKFSVTDLPANTEFDITVDNFSYTDATGQTFYFDGTSLYDLNNALIPGGVTYTAQVTMANGAFTLPPIVLFAEKDLVFVETYKAGSLAEPLPVRDVGVDENGVEGAKAQIEVTFTEALDPAGFNAYLTANGVTYKDYGSVKLKATEWSYDYKTVTLVAEEAPSGAVYGAIVTLPFNKFDTATDQTPTGFLTITAAKADGTDAFVAGYPVPVYTEEAIKLLSVEVIDPLDTTLPVRPSRSLFTVKLTGAVKLTFTKPIAENNINTSFTFTTARSKEQPDYLIDKNVVYVYIDQKLPQPAGDTGYDITYSVVSSAHPNDIILNKATVDKFTTDGLQKLVVSGTNLYDPNPAISLTAADGYQNGASYTPVNGPIEITFTRNIVGGKAEAELFLGNPYSLTDKHTNQVPLPPTAIVVNENKVTITLTTPLEPSTRYYLGLNVFDEGEELIYTTDKLDESTGLIYVEEDIPGGGIDAVPGYIGFTTAHKKLLLTETNLYYDKYQDDTSYLTMTPYFPLDEEITLTFNEPIPLTSPKTGLSNIVVHLYSDVGVPTERALLPVKVVGPVLTITPIEPLVGNTPYALTVSIQYGSQELFSTITDDYWTTYQGKHVARQGLGYVPGTGPVANTAIWFQTENRLSAVALVPNIGVAVPPVMTVAGDQDIVITFNKAIILDVDNSKLSYVDVNGDSHIIPTSEYDFDTTVPKVVKVIPRYTLAISNATADRFELALYVSSNEDTKVEQLVWDTGWKDNLEAIKPYADIANSLVFDVTDTIIPSVGPVLRSQKEVKTFPVTVAAPTAPEKPRINETVDLRWTVDPKTEIAGYNVWQKWQNRITWTAVTTPATIAGVSTVHTERVAVPGIGTLVTPVAKLDYIVQSKNEYGFVKQGRVVDIEVLGARLALAAGQVTPSGTPGDPADLQWSDTSTGFTTFYNDKNIVLVFNKDLVSGSLASPNYGTLYYDDGGVLRPSVATFTANGTTLTIDPTNLLAATADFQISFKVTAEDGDTLEYNIVRGGVTYDPNDPSILPYNIAFTTGGLSPGSTATPINLAPVVWDISANSQVPAAGVVNDIAAVGLKWSGTGYEYLADTAYTIENRYSDVNSAGAWVEPTKTRAAETDVLFRLSGGNDLATAKDDETHTVLYRVYATDRRGFALGGTTQLLVNAPKLKLTDVVGIDPIRGITSGDLTTNSLELDDDIVIEFNKPISSTNGTGLYYNPNPGLPLPVLSPLGTADYSIIVTGRFVTIRPTYVLAGGQQFVLKLRVTDVDGNTFFRDSSIVIPTQTPTRNEDPEDIVITTDAAVLPTVATPPVYNKAIRPLAITIAPTVPTAGLAANTATITLSWPRLPITTNTALYNVLSVTNEWHLYERGVVANVSAWSNSGAEIANGQYVYNATGAAISQAISAGSPTGTVFAVPHSALTPLAYVVEAIDDKGFLVQGTITVRFSDNN